jgi:uncharacterized protein involved in cysteine biosynthesis
MTFFTSIVGLLKTLLIILLVYFGFKTLAKIFAPLLLRFVAKKAEQRFGGSFNNQNNAHKDAAKEGETVIDKVPKRQKSSNKNVGEYIDFEELE